MKLFVVLTSFNEPETIGKAVEQILCPNKDLWSELQLIVTVPDEPTLKEAEKVCQKCKFDNFRLIKDPGQGKPVALNIAVDAITSDVSISADDGLLVLTDGDMYVSDDAIKNLLDPFANPAVGGVGGHPVSADSRKTMFGYYSHLFCEAAHKRRTADSNMPMSGYLYAIRTSILSQLYPLPARTRAEDAYITQKVISAGYKVGYASNALAYVNFPKNLADWFKQKTRSLGGNVQVSTSTRSITQDLSMLLFPLAFAKTPREFVWSVMLYPLRLLLWLKIYYNHIFNKYRSGMWDRIESSKY